MLAKLKKIMLKVLTARKSRLTDYPLSPSNQLNRYYKKVFSKNGEDGVIEYIFNTIGFTNRLSLEIGAHWEECNSRNLIENHNFNGILIDATLPSESKNINAKFVNKWITRENIDEIISKYFQGEIDFLSIDVDGIDLYLFDSIKQISPRVVCIEYCASLGDKESLTVPYKEDFERHKEHSSGFFCNASLMANINVFKKNGYKFIGTCFGLNAFFVKDNINMNEIKELTCATGWEPHYSRTYDRNISQEDQFYIVKDLHWVKVSENGIIEETS